MVSKIKIKGSKPIWEPEKESYNSSNKLIGWFLLLHFHLFSPSALRRKKRRKKGRTELEEEARTDRDKLSFARQLFHQCDCQ